MFNGAGLLRGAPFVLQEMCRRGFVDLSNPEVVAYKEYLVSVMGEVRQVCIENGLDEAGMHCMFTLLRTV